LNLKIHLSKHKRALSNEIDWTKSH